MTDMLSSPNYCFTVFPKRLSTNFSTNTFLSLYFSLISFMYSIIFWLLFTNRYHIPSHPITMYESSFVLSYSTMSGTEITGCSLYFFVSHFIICLSKKFKITNDKSNILFICSLAGFNKSENFSQKLIKSPGEHRNI